MRSARATGRKAQGPSRPHVMVRRALPPAVLFVALGAVTPARASDGDRSLGEHKPWLLGVFATGFVGDGLRFNNPYRLATVLGADARSLSRTAAYADVGAAFVVGDPAALAHGLALRATFARDGRRRGRRMVRSRRHRHGGRDSR